MKILITGASGFLGSWFLNKFIVEGGHDVYAMDILQHPTGLPVTVEDLEPFLADFHESVDLAFHFAAPVGGRMKIELDPMYNADAFRLDSLFFRWAVKHAKLAIYPSSSAIYPTSLQGSNGMLLNEGFIDARNPNWGAPDELYGFSKLAGEVMAAKAAEHYGLSTLCIRPFSGYGPHQSFDYPVPSILQRALRREDPLFVWGHGQQTRDFVYVTDIVAATMARIGAGVNGYETMNISSGWGTSFIDIARMAAEIVGYSPEIEAMIDKPVGVQNRRGDNQRMLRYYEPVVSLLDGLGYVLREQAGA